MRTSHRYTATAAALLLVGGCTERTSPPGEEPARPTAPPQASAVAVDGNARIAPARNARAILEPIDGSSVEGSVAFEQRGGTLHVAALATGLAAGKHRLDLHENGDCAGPGAEAAGGHFSAGQDSHAAGASEEHLGALGDFEAPFGGGAAQEKDTDQLTLDGEFGVVGKAVGVHVGNDDALLACGVVQAVSIVSDGARPAWIAGQSFADLDVDGNGFLGAAEAGANPALMEIFLLADRDQDGHLNVPEFSHATLEGTRVSADAARGPLFLELDLDENGRISPLEAQAVPQLRDNFSSFDVDDNDSVDEEEYAAALDQGLTPED